MPRVAVDFRVRAEVPAESLDDAVRWLFREAEPQIEAALSVVGLERVSFDQEGVRWPDERAT